MQIYRVRFHPTTMYPAWEKKHVDIAGIEPKASYIALSITQALAVPNGYS